MKILASFALCLCLSAAACAQQIYYVPTTVTTYENRVVTVPVTRNFLVPVVASPVVPVVAPVPPYYAPTQYYQPVNYYHVYYPVVVQRRGGCWPFWRY